LKQLIASVFLIFKRVIVYFRHQADFIVAGQLV
jgi:hypothetical protein